MLLTIESNADLMFLKNKGRPRLGSTLQEEKYLQVQVHQTLQLLNPWT